jgi:hypothetical protein
MNQGHIKPLDSDFEAYLDKRLRDPAVKARWHELVDAAVRQIDNNLPRRKWVELARKATEDATEQLAKEISEAYVRH